MAAKPTMLQCHDNLFMDIDLNIDFLMCCTLSVGPLLVPRTLKHKEENQKKEIMAGSNVHT